MTILTERLILEELSKENTEAVHQLHSLPETDQYNTLGIPKSMEETRQLIAQWLELQQAAPRKLYVYAIKEKEQSSFAGLIAMPIGKPNFRIAEVWYKLHPHFWGRGYATEALKGLLDFGFTQLKLHRIEAGCAVENVASVRVLEKAGMHREGSKRKVLPIRGQWVDNYEYAILEEDFKGNKPVHLQRADFK